MLPRFLLVLSGFYIKSTGNSREQHSVTQMAAFRSPWTWEVQQLLVWQECKEKNETEHYNSNISTTSHFVAWSTITRTQATNISIFISERRELRLRKSCDLCQSKGWQLNQILGTNSIHTFLITNILIQKHTILVTNILKQKHSLNDQYLYIIGPFHNTHWPLRRVRWAHEIY